MSVGDSRSCSSGRKQLFFVIVSFFLIVDASHLQKHRVADTRASDQLKLLQTYKDEMGNFQTKHQHALDEAKVSTKQLEEFKQKYYEMQRSERMLKVDIEQLKSRVRRTNSNSTYVVLLKHAVMLHLLVFLTLLIWA